MCNNNLFGSGNCCWIIILILIICSCCGNNGNDGGCGCGCWMKQGGLSL